MSQEENIQPNYTSILQMPKEERIQFILQALREDPYYTEEEGGFELMTEKANEVIEGFFDLNRSHPFITKFGDRLYFEPDNDLIERDGYLKAQAKHAVHFISQSPINHEEKRRFYHAKKANAIQFLRSLIEDPDYKKFQSEDIEKNRKEAIVYIKKICIKNFLCAILKAEIDKNGNLAMITILPDKKKLPNYWSDIPMVSFTEQSPAGETASGTSGDPYSADTQYKDTKENDTTKENFEKGGIVTVYGGIYAKNDEIHGILKVKGDDIDYISFKKGFVPVDFVTKELTSQEAEKLINKYKLTMKQNEEIKSEDSSLNEEYSKVGEISDYTKTMGLVKIIFINPDYNYYTNVSGDTTEQQARDYFVGKYFNVAPYPKEEMKKVIDIEFHPKGTYDEDTMEKGGKTKSPYYVRPISKETRKLFDSIGLIPWKWTNNGLIVAEGFDEHATGLYGLYTPEGEMVAPPKYQFIDEIVNPNGMTRVVDADGNSGAIEAFVQNDDYSAGGELGKNTYVITFQDAFSGATEVKEASMTDAQYQKALEQKANKDIVHRQFKNDIHWEWMIKDIRKKEESMANGGVIELHHEWTQDLQTAFDSAQETHNLWSVELDRTDDDNVKLIGDQDEIRSMKDSLFNSRVLFYGGSLASGGMISKDRAREIASHWHGGQNSALYQFTSSGVYMPENHLRYLRETQQNMETEYALHPYDLPKKDERELNSLKKFFEYKGKENGIGTKWEKHPQYGYMIPFITEDTKVEVKPLHLAMATGGKIRKAKVKISNEPYFKYVTVERELPQTIITNHGIFPKEDVIKEFTVDSRIIMEQGGRIKDVSFFNIQFALAHLVREGKLTEAQLDSILDKVPGNRIKISELKDIEGITPEILEKIVHVEKTGEYPSKNSMEEGGKIKYPYTIEEWASMLKEFYEYNNIDYSTHTTEMIKQDLMASPYGTRLDNKDAWNLALEIQKYFKEKKMAKGREVKMKHPKDHYRDMTYNGYTWQGFWNGKHHFVKKVDQGYAEIKATDEDLENGNIEFMAEHNLSNERRLELGGILLAGLLGAAIGGAAGYGYRDSISSARERAVDRAIKSKQAAKDKYERQIQKLKDTKEGLKSKAISGIQKLADGGRVKTIKESDIQPGAKFELINGEIVEIKRLFKENMDEDWAEFTRSSIGKAEESSVKQLKNFINNWRAEKKSSGGYMATGGNISAEKKKLQGEIKILQDAIDNSLLDDETKAKIPAKIEAKKRKIAEIEQQEEELEKIARQEQMRQESIEREKKLRTQSLKNKSIYIDIDKQFTTKMRNAMHSEGIPYESKTEGDTFRVFLSNQHQLDIVTRLYNEKREKYNLEPVSKEQVASVMKRRVGKLKFMPAKAKPNLKSRLSVEKKRTMKKAEKKRGISKGESEG